MKPPQTINPWNSTCRPDPNSPRLPFPKDALFLPSSPWTQRTASPLTYAIFLRLAKANAYTRFPFRNFRQNHRPENRGVGRLSKIKITIRSGTRQVSASSPKGPQVLVAYLRSALLRLAVLASGFTWGRRDAPSRLHRRMAARRFDIFRGTRALLHACTIRTLDWTTTSASRRRGIGVGRRIPTIAQHRQIFDYVR